MQPSRVALALTLAGVPVLLAAKAVEKPQMKLKHKDYSVQMLDYSFPSGLRVVFQEDHSQPMVSITAVNDRGSTSDPAGKEGIAHVIEHLWFRSIHVDDNGKPLPKVWDLLEEMGANLNAFTADDQTVYMTVAPSQNLPALLALEGLRMRDAVRGVTADNLTVEREVVRNELRMRYENDAGAVFGHLLVKLFPKTHPYGRAAFAGIGNNDSLNAITIDDIRKFAEDHYGPELTTIFVVGDIDTTKASQYLQEIGLDLMKKDPKDPNEKIEPVPPKVRVDVAAKPIEPPPPVEPAEVKGKVKISTVKGPVEGPLVALGWSVPGGWRNDQFMMQIAANQVAPAIYRELNTGWQIGSSPVEGIGCGLQAQLEGSAVICTIELASGEDPKKTVEKALDGLHHQWQFTEDPLSQKFQNYIFNYGTRQTMAFTLQSVDLISSLFSDRVTNAAMYGHYTGDLRYYAATFNAINNVKPAQLTAFAEKYITRERAVAVVMEPYEEGDVKEDSSDAQYRGTRREDAVETSIPVETLTPEFIAKTVIPPDVSKIQQVTLSNGMKLIVMPYTNGPLMQARLIFGGGTVSTPNGEATFADAMSRNESYMSVDSLALAGFDGMVMGPLHTEFDFSGSAGNVEDAMYVLHERVEGILPDTNGRIDWIKDRKGAVLDWMDDPAGWASRIQQERLMPNHPISKWYDHADIERMNGWNAKTTEKVYRAILQPENATLLVVGNVGVDEVKASAEKWLGGWQGWHDDVVTDVAIKTVYPPATQPGERQVLVFDKKNSSQTTVSYSCQLTPLTKDSLAASQVLASVLSEGTWLALREQTGASYGAYAYAYDYPGEGGVNPAYLGMQSLVQNDAAGLAVKAFLGLGEDAKAGKMDPKLVAIRKYAQAQEFVLGQQSSAQMADRLSSQLKKGLSFDVFSTYPKTLGNVSVDQMKGLMDRCVGHEVVTLVGPKDMIVSKLTAEKIPHTVFDWEAERVKYAEKHQIKSILKAEEKKKAEEAKKAGEKK